MVPYLAASDELKSKPTQHSVKEMLSIGINPDIIVCRTEHPLTDEIKHKISLFCNVDPECVIENNNCDILYAVPIMLHQQHMDDVVIRKLGIDCPGAPDLADWQEMLDALRHPVQTVKIALVGKYVELHDSYISVNEALKHGGIATHSAVDIHWIDSETLEGDDVDLDSIARITAGFTPADLENLLNEAAILAAKEDRQFLCQKDIQKAFIKVGIGTEKHSRVISEKEKKITAYHEAGHAILFHVLPDVGPVHTISIIPTGMGAAGYTMPLPEKDEMFNTKGKMLQDITVALGGRVAESLMLDDICTGASNDIERATKMARDMVTKYGFSEKLGPVGYASEQDEVFLGRDYGHTHTYSETVAAEIDEEVRRIMEDAYAKCEKILTDHRDQLECLAQYLLKYEKIDGEDFEKLMHGELVTPPDAPEEDKPETTFDPTNENPTPEA